MIIQTYNPDNYAIDLSRKQDYLQFYKTEIVLRKKLNYPPFCDIILLKFTGKDEIEIKKYANKIFNNLKKFNEKNEIKIYQPLPSPIDRIKGSYRWRLIIKGKVTLSLIEKIDKAISLENNRNVSVVVDINPNNMM